MNYRISGSRERFADDSSWRTTMKATVSCQAGCHAQVNGVFGSTESYLVSLPTDRDLPVRDFLQHPCADRLFARDTLCLCDALDRFRFARLERHRYQRFAHEHRVQQPRRVHRQNRSNRADPKSGQASQWNRSLAVLFFSSVQPFSVFAFLLRSHVASRHRIAVPIGELNHDAEQIPTCRALP